MKTLAALALSAASFGLSAAELDLAGTWSLADMSDDAAPALEAVVPGGVHDALLKAGRIPDIYWGANETNALWVGRHDWLFTRHFEVPRDILASSELVLRLEDCDAFARVSINGVEVGETTDRFQRYTFDVKKALKPGENILELAFRSPEKAADERREKAGRAYPMSNVMWAKNQALVRKPACHAGWDWGPSVQSIGPCGTVKIIASNAPRVEYIYTTQQFNDDLSHCTLTVFADLSDGNRVTTAIEIDNPPLWWPNGAGEQRFYTFTVNIAGADYTRRIGLRKLEVLNERTVSPDGKDELSLVFKVNNRRIFMKGANWIPCDAYESRQTPERYRELLSSAKAANMNMIRLWGGGQYEKDCFYDMCDEMGLLVWHDMMHACAVYPAEGWFLDELRAELAHQLRRLRDHASIAMWCGDNECLGAIGWFEETRADKAFYRSAWIARSKMQGEMVAMYDPARTYWPSSPCCGPGDFGDAWKDDSKGDMHNWDVWHENAPFSRYYDYRPRFCSEFGYQSFSSPGVAAGFSNGPGDDFEWHQKNDGGNRRIRETMLRYFGRAKDFDSELMLSQFQQAMAIQTAVEAWRAEMPRCMGTLFWQFNDNWPVASWSSIEYGGKWKPLHYLARRFFAPVHVAAAPDGSITGVNDTPAAVDGELTVEHWAYDGRRPLMSATSAVALAPGAATKIGAFPVDNAARARGSFVVVRLKTASGEARSEWHFSKYRDVPLADAKIRASVQGRNVTLSTDRPAFFVWVDVRDAKGEFTDNCLTLLPGRPVVVSFAGEFDASALKVISLADTLAKPRLSRVRLGGETKDGRPSKRWRGFNLTDMLSIDYNKDGGFSEQDFQMIADWGFNFVRLPLDYRYFWHATSGPDEVQLAKLDQAVEWGRRYGVHVQLCLHRIPGYTSGVPKEERDLFSDKSAQDEACAVWRVLAGRYKGVSNEILSFNLFNEPEYIKEKKYAPVAKLLLAAIREADPDRFVVADALGYGRIAPNTLLGEKSLGFGWHCYDPFFVTHYQTPWNNPSSVKEPPRWPVDSTDPREWLIKDIYTSKGWDEAVAAGAFVYVGEFGVWRKTKHSIALSLMQDQLRLWQELNVGWALWNLRGDFGVLDSGREDVDYEEFRGHKLDRAMLELLRSH